MNKILRVSLFGILMMVCGLVSAQTTVTFDATVDKSDVTEASKDVSITKDGIKIQLSEGMLGNGEQYRCYKGQSMKVSSTVGNIVKVALVCTANGTTKYGPGCFTVTDGTYKFEDEAKDGEWTGDASSVVFTASSNQVRMTKIEVTYLKSGEEMKKDPELSFSESVLNVTMGSDFTVPTLTKATSAAVVYASSNENVATVDAATGALVLVAPGTSVITASVEATDTYAAGSASYNLVVNDVVRTEVDEPYSETFETGIGSFTINDVMLGEGITYVWKHDASFKYMKASAYNKKNIESESWMISPVIKLAETEVVRYVVFEQCINKYFGDVTNEATLWVKEQGGDWKQLSITYPALPETGNWSQFETQVVSLAGYEGKNIQIGFKYTSTSEAAGTWEIKNFKVSTDNPTSINKIEADKVSDGAIYNLSGQRLSKPAKGINIIGGKKVVVK